MKNILFFVLFVSTLLSNAQTSVYYPMPDSNAYWTVNYTSCCFSSCCPNPPSPNPRLSNDDYTYSISGDTTINNITYKKVLRSGIRTEYCNLMYPQCPNDTINYSIYFSAIRQDILNKKVYFNDGSGEQLLYDFAATIGGTISGIHNEPVNSIDSILIGSNYRKRINTLCYSVIEGIGSTQGLFEFICPFEQFSTLICFSQNGQVLYPDTLTNCEFLTQISELQEKDIQSKIYPNPFISSATLIVNDQFVNSHLKIYDTMGNMIKNQIILSSSTDLFREHLTSGMYYYQILGRKGKSTYGKFIVQD